MKQIPPNIPAMIIVIHAVHRHPRELCVINPPMMGPRIGPKKVAAEKTATARPRFTGSKKSAKHPPTMAGGAAAKTPPKKRQSKIVSRLTATAMGI